MKDLRIQAEAVRKARYPSARESVQAYIRDVVPIRIRWMMDYLLEKSPQGEYGIHYVITDTQYAIELYFRPCRFSEEWQFAVGVHLEGYSWEYSCILKHGSWEEIAAYLKTEDAVKQTMAYVPGLIQKVDEADD